MMENPITTTNWLGDRVRQVRKARGQTLSQLSQTTGFAMSTLSKIENGRLSVTFDNLLVLAKGLDIDIATLLSHQNEIGPTGRRSVTRKNEGDLYETNQYVYELLCTDIANKKMIPIVAELKSGSIAEFGPLIRHSGEEFVYVLEGEVAIYSEFYEPLVLKKGDSTYFDSTMGHALVHAADERAVILWMCTNTAGPVKAAAPAFGNRVTVLGGSSAAPVPRPAK